MKDKKTIIIIILLIISLSLGGYLLYDKAFSNKCNTKETISPKDNETSNEAKENTTSKDNTNSNETTSGNNTSNDTTTSRKDYEYVGLAFNGYKVYNWPTSEFGKESTDPDQTTNNISIPKILIDTPVTKIINQKILKNYQSYIDTVNTNDQEAAIASTTVSYRYAIYKDILFIMVTDSYLNHRAGGGVHFTGYYYDIKNDAELSLNDVIKKLNINVTSKLKAISDKIGDTAKTICGIIPGTNDSGKDYYYSLEDTCGSMDDYYVNIYE